MGEKIRIAAEQGRETQRSKGEPGTDPAIWVDIHGDALFRFALLRLGNREAAEDAVQDCFVSALAARRRFMGQSGERTWLIGILRRKIVDRFRTRMATVPSASIEGNPEFFDEKGLWKVAPETWNPVPEAAAQQTELRRTLGNCLAKLPSGIREAFILTELDRMPGRDVCEVMGISPANLWQRLHRARLLLQRCLELNWYGTSRPT